MLQRWCSTTIIRECLQHSLLGTVEVRVEEPDILIMLVHYYDQEKHHIIIVTTLTGSVQSLTYEQRKYLLFVIRLLDVILYLPSMGSASRNCMQDFSLEILVL